jgi:hypothetical protein
MDGEVEGGAVLGKVADEIEAQLGARRGEKE